MTKKVTATDFEGNPIEVEVSKLTWRPSAYGIVIKDNKILLLKQTNGYDLPGGGLDLDETPEEAVIREIKEETGIDATSPHLLDVVSSFYLVINSKDNFRHSLMIYYACEHAGGELSKAGFDESEQNYAIGPEWVSIEKLDNIQVGSSNDFRPYVKRLLK